MHVTRDEKFKANPLLKTLHISCQVVQKHWRQRGVIRGI